MGTCLTHIKNRHSAQMLQQDAAFYVVRKKRHAHDDGTVRLVTKKGLKYVHQRFVNQKRQSILDMIPESDKNKQKALQQFYCCYNKMMAFFDDHDIDNAFQVAQHIQNKHNQTVLQIDPKNQSKESRQIKRIIRQYNDIEKSYQQIYGPGWIQKSNKKRTKISTKKQGSSVAVMAETILEDIPFQVVVATLHQSQLLKEYMPFVYTSKHIKSLQRNIHLGYTIAKPPLITQRQSFFQAGAYKRLDKKNCIVLYTRSLSNRNDLQQQYQYNCQLDPKRVQLTYDYFILKYQPISKNTGKCTMALNADMKIGGIPTFLIDIGQQVFGNQIFASFRDIAKKYQGSLWQQRVKKNSAYYNWINQNIQDYLQDKQQKSKGGRKTSASSQKMMKMV